MLLRLRVQGFKNLHEADVRFGPLTCFVGPNGVGKSNIFDAIQLLRHLADKEIQHAAEAIRQPTEGTFSPLELFWNQDPAGVISMSADMLVPSETVDGFGESVKPTNTLLRYSVSFDYSLEQTRLILVAEDLDYYRKGEAREVIGFPHTPSFRNVIAGARKGGAFISTSREGGNPAVKLHGDGGSRGRPVSPGPSPRTILGGTGTREYPTVVAARREMSSWHALHLEPSSLRTPDRFGERGPVDEHGKHIAATLHRLDRNSGGTDSIYRKAANQLSRLVPGVESIRGRTDDVRASGLTGPRRSQRFRRDLGHAVQRVAAHISDFSPLRELPAFRAFESACGTAVDRLPRQSK